MTMFGPIPPEEIADRVSMIMRDLPRTHVEIFEARCQDIAASLGNTSIHPSLEARPGVNPEDEDYFSQLGETRGD